MRASYNTGLMTRDMENYKAASYNLRKAVKEAEAKRKYKEKMEAQSEQSDTRHLWQSMQTVVGYKGKPLPTAQGDVSLASKLNSFYACFEANPTTTSPLPPQTA